jgi:hypothetical protein
MASSMKVVSGDYEEVAIDFLMVLALEVDLALKHGGITDVDQRREIVDYFCFGMGNFFDQHWFQSGDKKYYPVLCFSEKHLDDEPEELGLPDSFSYHDYAFGMFDQLTEDGNGSYQIQVGLVGEDEPLDLSDGKEEE